MNKPLSKPLQRTLMTGFLLSFWLFTNPLAFAEYKPSPHQKPAPKDLRSEGATTRGCDGTDLSPTVLASRNYIGKTVSSHPNLAWFIPDSKPLPMELRFYEIMPNQKAKEIYRTFLQTSPGIMQLSPFPKDKPGLEIGKQYFWQVIIYCVPNEPSSALVDGANLEVIPMPSELQRKLEKTTDSSHRANLYAEAGLWYDALNEALKVAPAEKLGVVGSNLLQNLISAENPTSEQQLSREERQRIEQRNKHLQQIANTTK